MDTESTGVVDLNLYVALVDFFEGLENEGRFEGSGTAAAEWFRDHDDLSEGERDYVLLGLLRLVDHWKGEDWERRERLPELDRRVWTFHRVWVDRYGWEPTMEAGRQRRRRSPQTVP